MGRDTWRFRAQEKERLKRKQINPIWRGIGCVLIIGLSVGGYFFADWVFYQNDIHNWFSLPGYIIDIPFLPWLPSGILLKLGVALVFMVVSYGVMSLLYAILFPIQPGECDSPPLKRKPRRRP
jgi:hypothetical protein